MNSPINNIPSSILFLDEVDSTNDFLKDFFRKNIIHTPFGISARYQTNGKGMRGNIWSSDQDQNVLISFLVDEKQLLISDYQLNVVACLTVIGTIGTLVNEEVRIKWPNDIYIEKEKVAGILIENIYEGMHRSFSVVGIGLNVNQKEFNDDIKATSLIQFSGQSAFDRLKILHKLFQEFYKIIALPYELNLRRFNQFLFQKNEKVSFQHQEEEVLLEIMEVLADGKLKVKDENGLIFAVSHPDYQWKK